MTNYAKALSVLIVISFLNGCGEEKRPTDEALELRSQFSSCERHAEDLRRTAAQITEYEKQGDKSVLPSLMSKLVVYRQMLDQCESRQEIIKAILIYGTLES